MNAQGIFSDKIHVVSGSFDPVAIIREVTRSVEDVEDAFYVCNIGEIVRRHTEMLQAMPRVTPHYAVKCNDEAAVLCVLAAIGASYDCASKRELQKVLDLGVSPDRIIYANPTKAPSHLRYAHARNVRKMTFDNSMELYKIKRLFADAELVLRFRCDAVDAETILGSKFGCNPDTEGPELLRLAQSLNLNVIGVSFHVGSGCREFQAYNRAIKHARDLFDFAQDIGYDFKIVDIGGGFPGERHSSIEPFAAVINAALGEYFPDQSVRVISEPGKYYVTSAFTLASNVIARRQLYAPGEPEHNQMMYYINEGVFNSFLSVLCQIPIPEPTYLKDALTYGRKDPAILWGSTCDSTDKLFTGLLMPELSLGDWMVFADMGAYSIVCATQFNGLSNTNILYMADAKTSQLLRKSHFYRQEDFIEGSRLMNVQKSTFNAGVSSLPSWPKMKTVKT